MELDEFKEQILEKSKGLDICFSVEQISKFYQYMTKILVWNQKVNLTAITKPSEIIQKHFVDSLTILNKLDDSLKIIDVGTGAGFPGIPLSIMNPTLKITLIDSLNKRLIFLEDVVNDLKLKNVEIIHARAEELGQNLKFRESFDIATSRAVANLSTLSEYLLPFVKINGKVISMKAANAEQEINDAKKAIDLLGGCIDKIEKFNLPDSDIGRTVIIINKAKCTPNKYPRKPGMPSKDPIK